MLSPKASMVVNVVIAVLAAVVGAGATAFPDYVPHVVAVGVVQTSAFTLMIFGAVNGALHAYSAPGSGPLVASPPAAKALALALLGGLAALALIDAPPAQAAPKAPPYTLRPMANPPVKASNPLNAIGAWATGDVDAAIAAATHYADVQDQVGAACLGGIKTLAQMIADHPLPLTFKVATDIEYARLIQGEMNLLCRNTACQQVWSDMENNAKALEIAPLSISFSSFCAKVPVVGLTLTAATPAPTVSPTPGPMR